MQLIYKFQTIGYYYLKIQQDSFNENKEYAENLKNQFVVDGSINNNSKLFDINSNQTIKNKSRQNFNFLCNGIFVFNEPRNSH